MFERLDPQATLESECAGRERSCYAATMMRSLQKLVFGLAVVTSLTTCYRESRSTSANEITSDPAAQALRDLVGFLPLRSDLVLHVDMRRVRASALWPAINEAVKPVMELLVAECKYDPLQTIEDLRVGITKLDNDRPHGVFVIGGMDRSKTLACARRGALAEELTVSQGVIATKRGIPGLDDVR